MIQFLYDLSENVPGIYYGEYSDYLGSEFETIVEKLKDKVINVEEATDEFEDICGGLENIFNPPILDNIVIEIPPEKTTYYEYEVFNKTGMVVRAYYLDGTTSIVGDYTISPEVLSLDMWKMR